jgi:putative pyoverdin transport system ATP-binding/permease protein
MTIFTLLFHSRSNAIMAISAGVISGLSNAALLALFSKALIEGKLASKMLFWSFLGLCFFLPLTRFISESLLARLVQGAMLNLRMKLSRQILAASLRYLEQLGEHKLMTALIDDVSMIAGTLSAVPVLAINIATIIGGLIYLGLLSSSILLVVMGFMFIGILTYQIPVVKAFRSFTKARESADALFHHLRALTSGTKELKLHNRRREAFLSQTLQDTAWSFKKHNVDGMTIYAAASSWGQALVFAVIGLILFSLPSFQIINSQIMTGFTLTLLYLMTPLQVIMNLMPHMSRANIALKRLADLSRDLKDHATDEVLSTQQTSPLVWDRLDLIGVTHSYKVEGEEHNFTLGPINLTIHTGELVFIIGGNGSGKTTLAKLITGLYVPEDGEMQLNGHTITKENRAFCRQYFSMVFSDFYLFESFLGLERATLDDEAKNYLIQLQLDQKVKVNKGLLSTTDLSQGQRKRLALLTAYLEDRPIYIFDEWAADQDPVFKNVFYYHILPELKAKGKTVIVISHDDRYYSVADRVIKLEYGKIVFDNPIVNASSMAV